MSSMMSSEMIEHFGSDWQEMYRAAQEVDRLMAMVRRSRRSGCPHNLPRSPDEIMRPGLPIPEELSEQYGAEFDALAARHCRSDRLLSLRLPARRQYITVEEYNSLIDAIVEVVRC